MENLCVRKHCHAYFENIKGVHFDKVILETDENNKIGLILLASTDRSQDGTIFRPKEKFKLFADLLGRKYKVISSNQNYRTYARGDDMRIVLFMNEFNFSLQYRSKSFEDKKVKFDNKQKNQQSKDL